MIDTDKPPLNEETLAHYGVKGMKWGVRRERTASETAARSARNQKIVKSAKVAGGVALVAGAAAVAVVLYKNGNKPAANLVMQGSVDKLKGAAADLAMQKAQDKGKRIVENMMKQNPVPSADELMAQARMAGVRNQVNVSGDRRLAERAWRDEARFNQTRKAQPPPPRMPDLTEIRRRMDDPNYVWEL